MKSHRRVFAAVIILSLVVLVFQRKIEVDVSRATASSASKTTPKESIQGSLKSKISKEPTHDKVDRSDIHAAIPSSLSQEQREVLCKLKSLRTQVPLEGDVQIYVDQRTPFFGGAMGNVAWIKSKACPEGMYSIVHFTDDGKITREVDCRKSNLTEISALSGEQGNIIEAPTKDGYTNLALVGNGYFVLSCLNGEVILTRDGQFRRSTEGYMINQRNCALVSQHGTFFQGFGIDSSGCNSNAECVATVDPSSDEVSGLQYINNHSFKVDDIVSLMDSITKKGEKILRPSFFVNALEDVHNSERGLTSVSWSNHPHINMNDMICNPSHLE